MASKIKIDKELLKKVRQHARTAGYASEEEFVAHALEKEIARLETVEPEEEVKRKLEGLGYIG
jgi:metal-responsive CopG/Arc/MetJ family transcriptional regulator